MKKTHAQSKTTPVAPGWLKTGFPACRFYGYLKLVMTMFGLLTLSTVVVQASLIQLLSARNPSVPFTAGGDGDSVAPVITPDGRYVVFSSEANDLAPGGNDQFVMNVYLRDRTANTTVLISANTNGMVGNGDSMLGQVSANGRYVVFQSDASDLVPGDTKGITDVFLRDTYTGITRLISVAADGGCANGPSTDPVMTQDGTCVAFISAASNLVPGDTNGIPDVFVRDLITQTTWLISVGATASTLNSPYSPNRLLLTNMATPVITPDGRYVAFFSSTSNLVAGVPPFSEGEVYVRDRLAGTTTWASAGSATIGSNYFPENDILSYHPRLSDDGQYVVFKTSTNYNTSLKVPAVIARYNLATGTTTIINSNGIGAGGDLDNEYDPEMTPDGNDVAYVQQEGNLNPNYCSVHVWDAQGGVDTLVSDPGSNGVITSTSQQPVLSADDSSVAFLSNATNLLSNAVTGQFHIYLRNLTNGSLQLVDADTNGIGSSDEALAVFSVNSSGLYVAFDSLDGSLVNGDNNDAYDVFTRDLFSDTTEMDSRRDASIIPQTGDFLCESQVSVSTNGQWAAFASAADNLTPNDTNNEPDVFVSDLLAGTTTLASAGADGGAAGGGPSLDPVISGNGRYVSYSSMPSGIIGATSPLRIWDDQLGTDVYTNTAGVSSAALDANGTRALYSLSSSNTLVDDILTGTNVFTFNYPFMMWSPGGFSADGRFVTFVAQTNAASGTNIYLCDLQNQTIILVSSNFTPFSNAGPADLPVISADGRFVVYRSSATGIVPGDNSPAPNIYRYDSLLGTTSDLTAGQAGTGPVLWDSAPAVNSDGGTVAFLSLGSGLASPDLNRAPDAFAFAMDVGMPLDSDGDGIPDWWMIKYFGHPTGLASDNSLAQDDADGTGMSNLQKYLAGLDPTNPASLFRITSINLQAASALISWQAGGGRTNIVQAAATVGGPYTNISPAIALPGSGDVSTNYLDTTTNQPTRFYRIKLGP